MASSAPFAQQSTETVEKVATEAIAAIADKRGWSEARRLLLAEQFIAENGHLGAFARYVAEEALEEVGYAPREIAELFTQARVESMLTELASPLPALHDATDGVCDVSGLPIDECPGG